METVELIRQRDLNRVIQELKNDSGDKVDVYHLALAEMFVDFKEMDLLVIAYKMLGNREPIERNGETMRKAGLIWLIIRLLANAAKRLEGQTLPADLDKINRLTL